jgi:phosphate uptake regulator
VEIRNRCNGLSETELFSDEYFRKCRYNSDIIKEFLHSMKTTPEWVEARISFFSAIRHLERIADHATNIAQDVVISCRAKSSAIARQRWRYLLDPDFAAVIEIPH